MEIKNIVQTNADIVRVTSLAPDDYYQRLETGGYGGPRMRVGVVTGVHVNGEEVAVTAIEFPTEYGDGGPAHKVFGTDSDVALFPVTQLELDNHLDRALKHAHQARERVLRDLDTANSQVATLTELWDARNLLKPAPTSPALEG
jgi:hypothetical protein